MTMVEKVARAIYEAPDPLSGDTIATVIVSSEHLFPSAEHFTGDWPQAYQLAAMDVCRTIARAAIEAMREPTEAMLNVVNGGTFCIGDGMVTAEDMGRLWPLLIDAASDDRGTE